MVSYFPRNEYTPVLFILFFIVFLLFFSIFIHNPKKVSARKWQFLHTILHTSYHLYDIWEHKHIFNYIGICYFDFERFENKNLKLSFILSPRATLDVFTKNWLNQFSFQYRALSFYKEIRYFWFQFEQCFKKFCAGAFFIYILIAFAFFFSFFWDCWDVFWALN